MKNPLVFFLSQLFLLFVWTFFTYGEGSPYRVGVCLGLSGPAAKWSKYQRMGIELAEEQFRNANVPLKLVFEDSKSEPAGAVTSFKKLSEIDKVEAVVGDIFSYVTAPLIPLADQKKILLVSPSVPKQYCSQSKGWFFSSSTQVPMAKAGYSYFLDHNPSVKRIALVYFDDPGWGHSYRDGWRELAKSRGLEIVEEFESAEFRPDFKSVVPRMLVKKPEAFFVAHEPETFIKTARQLGFKGDLVFANNIQEVLTGSTFSADLLEGVYFVDTLADSSFSKAFYKKFSEQPILEAYNGYEALRTVVKALIKNRKNPSEAVQSLNYQGVSGLLDYRKTCAGNFSRWHLKRFSGDNMDLIK